MNCCRAGASTWPSSLSNKPSRALSDWETRNLHSQGRGAGDSEVVPGPALHRVIARITQDFFPRGPLDDIVLYVQGSKSRLGADNVMSKWRSWRPASVDKRSAQQ